MIRRPLLAGLAMCLALSSWSPASPRPVAYEVYKLPIHNVAAVTFGPSGSELTLVIPSRGLGKWNPRATVPATLEVVNFRTGKVVFKKKITASDTPPPFSPYWLSYVNAGRELAYCDEFAVQIFELPGYTEEARIPVGGPVPGPVHNPSALPVGRYTLATNLRPAEAVSQAAFSAGGQKLATVTRLVTASLGKFGTMNPDPDETSFTVHLFDLGSLKEEGNWDFRGHGGITGFAISPTGARVAWSIFDYDRWQGTRVPRGTNNVKILDVASGKTIGIHTNDVADRLAFASDKRLLSISYNAALRRYAGDGIRIWDASTGKLLGEVRSKPNGVHNALTISRDGRVVAGFVGQDKTNENFIDPKETQFRLWSPGSWAVLFTSPVVHPLFNDEYPQLFTQSPDGHSVLVWNASSKLPLVVYHIPAWE